MADAEQKKFAQKMREAQNFVGQNLGFASACT